MSFVAVTAVFDAEYCRRNYRDYDRQNPPRKLRYYARFLRRSLLPDVPRRMHDIGCAFGKFLGALDETWTGWERYGSDVSEHATRREPVSGCSRRSARLCRPCSTWPRSHTAHRAAAARGELFG